MFDPIQKKTWTVINNILQSNKKRNKAVIKSILFNDITYENNPDIARIFNEHFSTVGRRIDDFLQSNHSTNSIPTDYMPNFSTQNSFFFRRSNTFDVNKIIMSLKNKSSHISTYSVKIIKHFKYYFSNFIPLHQ